MTLLRGAVDTKIDFNPKIFHHKFIIRDRGEAREAVLTRSTNFTTTDTHRNLNHVVIFHDIGVAAAYQSEFDQLRDGIFGARSPKLTSTDPLTLDIEGSLVQIMFSPDNNPELRIVNEILKAQTSAYFMMFTFAKTTTNDDAEVLRAKWNVVVTTRYGIRRPNRVVTTSVELDLPAAFYPLRGGSTG